MGGVSLPAHGEIGFDADGARWRLVFGINALCRLEAETDDGDEVRRLLRQDPAQPKLSTVRAAFWAGLQDHHPELTLDDAGNLVTHLGLDRAGDLVAQALLLAFPPARKGRGPRKAVRTTA